MKEWIVIDGYNVINSWQDFRRFREENLEHARELLKEKIAEYIAFKGYNGILVFDAQEAVGQVTVERFGLLDVVFTGEGETADTWIERRVYELMKTNSNVFVVTSDYAEQLNVLGSGLIGFRRENFTKNICLLKSKSPNVVNVRQEGLAATNLAADCIKMFYSILKNCGAGLKN